MAKVLSRPMFRRGGSTNSGVVSGFKKGGNVRQGYANGELVDLYKQYMTAPEEDLGMSTSDWLRIAASGADIMGAPGTGRNDVWGALQAAGPALGDLGTGLADTRDARRANYLQRKAVYDAGLADTAITGASTKMERDFTSDEARKQRFWEGVQAGKDRTHDVDITEMGQEHEVDLLGLQFSYDKKLYNIEATAAIDLLKEEYRLDDEYGRYDFEKQYQTAEAEKLAKEMIQLDEDSDEYKEKAQIYQKIIFGEIYQEYVEQKGKLGTDADFLKLVRSYSKDLIEAAKDPDSPDHGKTDSQITEQAIQHLFSLFGVGSMYVPPAKGNAMGGTPIRRNFALGGSAPMTNAPMTNASMTNAPMNNAPMNNAPMNTPPMNTPPPTNELQLSFAELRKRLPPEVSDAVITLILNSEEAMIDFAKLQTSEDINIFNQKYNTDLQLPQQVV